VSLELRAKPESMRMEANEAANDRAKLADASGVCEHLLNMERSGIFNLKMRCGYEVFEKI
jgi:hypothetical protein